MYGIICKDDLPGHSLFNNYRLALENYFNTKFVEIDEHHSLYNIDTVFIVDEHFGPHVSIWKTDHFINTVNDRSIKVVVFNFEKIFDALFPWNIDHQRTLERIKNLVQFVSDVEDANKLGHKLVNRQLLSIETILPAGYEGEKLNRILFIGQTSPNVYNRRRALLASIAQSSLAPFVDVVDTQRKMTYPEYLMTLSKYKYVLNPLGTGDFINIRHYEANYYGCTVLQQYTPEMLKHYPELHNGTCFPFQNAVDIPYPDVIPVATISDTFLEDRFDRIKLDELIFGKQVL